MKPSTAKLLCLFLFFGVLAGQWWFTKAFALTVDKEPDGEIYLALAHNLFTHGVYSASEDPELIPTYMRLPGYPLMIAGVFALSGDGNDGAVRDLQAVLATLTCACVAWLAFLWAPFPTPRARAALIAFLLAAVCPFTVIYAGIILTETLTFFLVMLLILAATWAFRADSSGLAISRWLLAGLVAGALQLVRPESGLFAAAVGFTLVGFGLFGPRRGATAGADGWQERWPRVLWHGAAFSCAFIVTLVPWTVRNARVFHTFAPLPPANLAMPGERTYHGFCAWYRTWADSERYLQPFYWDMTDNLPTSIDGLPSTAFDTAEERTRTIALFEQYNAPTEHGTADLPCKGLTPELDAAFGQLARERAARSPWRYYVLLPLQRAVGLWFVPHAQYYSFEGSLFPLSQLKPDFEYHLWLPIFFALLCVYTALGLVGMWRLLKTREPDRANAWRWLGLVILVVLPRWAYLSTLENTEPRYMAEIFPFLCVLGGIAFAGLGSTNRKTISAAGEILPGIPSPVPAS